jgi:3-methyladenine DNA glycosylase AlkD
MNTAASILTELALLGDENTKKIYLRHGAKEPIYGVRVADIKNMVKKIGKNYPLALEVFATGNSDAMYLAGYLTEPSLMTQEELQLWAEQANWYMISEYTIAWVTAESRHSPSLPLSWIEQKEENLGSSGWASLAGYIAITPNTAIQEELMMGLLERIRDTIHLQPNRVKYTMNGFLISVGAYLPQLREIALQIANNIGKVKVELGKTACKVPEAGLYIQKMVDLGKVDKKKKSLFC